MTEIPAAKRAALIQDISAELMGCHIKDKFPVAGKWYELQTLDYGLDSWSGKFIDASELVATGKTTRGAIVAAALTAIGRTENSMESVETLFVVPDDMPKDVKEYMAGDPERTRTWRQAEVLRWLTSREHHPQFVKALYDNYLELDRRRMEALTKLGPLSRATPSGGSSDTSSHEKVSS